MTALSGKRRSWRSLVVLLVLVAFTAQTFLVQSHIHQLPVAAAAGPAVIHADGKAPADTDRCILCQEYLHSGSFLTPLAIAALPPQWPASLLPFVLEPVLAERVMSHNWMGRAPPRA